MEDDILNKKSSTKNEIILSKQFSDQSSDLPQPNIIASFKIKEIRKQDYHINQKKILMNKGGVKAHFTSPKGDITKKNFLHLSSAQSLKSHSSVGRGMRGDSQFESYYNSQDSMQSEEMSFFKNNFKYEGDDQQSLSREEGLSRTAQTSAFMSRRNLKIDSKQDEYENDSYNMNHILSELQEPLEDTYHQNCQHDLKRESQEIEQTTVNDEILQAILLNKKDILKIINSASLKGNLNLSHKNQNGMNAILLCCYTGNLDLIKVLVNEYKGNLSSINSMNKRIGLHYACLHNHPEIVSYFLLMNPILKNFQDIYENTPLFYAVLNSAQKCVELLIISEAQIDLPNSENLTVFDVVTKQNILKLLKLKKKERTTQTDESVLREQGNDHYSRTPILKSEHLAFNSRKDKVNMILLKTKNNYQSQQKQSNGQSDSAQQPIVVKEKKNTTQNKQFYQNEWQQQRQKSLQILMQKKWNLIQKKIEAQKQCQQDNLLIQEIQKKMEMPLKVRREVTIDDFIFYRKVGSGSFGEVYLVKIKKGIIQVIDGIDRSDQLFALKVIKKELLHKKKVISYIEFEKNIMQNIKHPFLSSLHLSFQNGEYLFLLMDFYEGGDLGRILGKDIKVSEKQVKIWAAQIVLALEELHSKDIIYRDLKPENVVLDAMGNIHLIDFGLAKQGVNALTQSFCGTPIYLPPEILAKSGHNKMVDWYSLGVIIYELLVGRPPYFSRDCKQLFDDIQTQPLRLPLSLQEESKSILVQLLKKNYKTRLGYLKDAEEVKQHPWFNEIDWDKIYKKKYECYNPIPLKIPTEPIEHKLNAISSCPIHLERKWSFFLIDEPTLLSEEGSEDDYSDSEFKSEKKKFLNLMQQQKEWDSLM